MILDKAQVNELREKALPLMIWMEENCHPHTLAIVDSEGVTVFEGLAHTLKTPPPCQPPRQ